MGNQHRKTIFTTIGIDNETNALVERICKRYSLKKGEIVKLAFLYLEKAHINPADAPESVKTELAKINKRQDDIIRFIRSYEEKELNPMIRTSHSIAVKFDASVKEQTGLITSEINTTRELQDNVLKKISETFNQHATVINNQAKQITDLSQAVNASSKKQERNNNKLLKLISLYSELATCGVMDGKRKENLKNEINDLINEKQ
ncbi:clindamycin resistance transfer factor BtgA [Dysgonomonas sp. 216]|uniref:BfmA/BtgA family mobilization protein n=1 Tax=unclassified Dysgonomonas TaxID=2630389 RepID=UPI0013D51A1E|nr:MULTISPECIES: BfmA/BtgA family mobilization protein [unclassified Dysgonomonas]NDV67766.1 clindamycin resistance transfer factor BtgA [Dysgonomonas sp. 25]NDW19081.1 clindamycin resistance transfer factor BtgA [Dysgonomonas sp. 216]